MWEPIQEIEILRLINSAEAEIVVCRLGKATAKPN
jgi:hypothetical protein